MSIKQPIAKKGAAAVYVVIFTATLLSIISLSFVRLMLSEMGRTTNYSLSQSAYNSALAGIEDAKIVLLRYQNCVNARTVDAAGHVSYNYKVNGEPIECAAIVKAFTEDSEKTAEDCDAVGRLLGYNTENHETIIKTDSENAEVTGSAAAFDQAYTCVRVSSRNRNYLTTLTNSAQTKIVPIRTISNDDTNSVNRIVISWFSRKDLTRVSKNSDGVTIDDITYHSYKLSSAGNPLMNGAIKRNNAFAPSGGASNSYYRNTFTSQAVVPSTIRATLVQTAREFHLSDFYSSKAETVSGKTEYHTDRGSILLRPTTNNLYNLDADTTAAAIKNYSNHISGGSSDCGSSDCFSYKGGPFATSANKSQNTPLDVYCYTNEGINTPNGYACTADIFVPRPVAYSSSNKRNYTTFFLVLNLPYGSPGTEVSVELRNCKNDSDSIYTERGEGDSTGCKTVYFANVQPIVDSTGRANDLFRRVEARVELVDNYFPIANYALAVEDPNSDDDTVEKDFYVTNNCEFQEHVWDSELNRVVTRSTSCNNSEKRSS